jgi:hypothetical protein
MKHKQAPAFSLATELAEPDALVTIGASSLLQIGFLSRIRRSPQFDFQPTQTLPPGRLDPGIISMLPRGANEVAPPLPEELEEWFGPTGRFPAIKIGKRRARSAEEMTAPCGLDPSC